MDAPHLDPRIAAALRLMEQRMGQPLSVAHLAAAVNLSPSRFARVFSREIGTPPAKYLHGLRMTRARTLVVRSSLTIGEIMAQVGVHDPSHFARDFRRAHGVSPLHLRRRLRYPAPPVACRPADDD
jgi:transcriptional regulator GlxA family with amidase domain